MIQNKKIAYSFVLCCCIVFGEASNVYAFPQSESDILWLSIQDLTTLPKASLRKFQQSKKIILYNQILQQKIDVNQATLTELMHNFPEVPELCFSGLTLLPGLTLEHFQFLSKIEFVNCLFDAQILARLPSLVTTLTLKGPQINNADLYVLSQAPATPALILNSCPNITDAGLAMLQNTNLESLIISWCTGLTNCCLSSLPHALKYLTVRYNKKIAFDDSNISALPPSITVLNISNWHALTEIGYGALPKQLQLLALATQTPNPALLQIGMTERITRVRPNLTIKITE